MKTLLVNMPIGVEARRPPNVIPTGIAILANVLRRAGEEVRILDLNALRLPDDEAYRMIAEEHWDVVGMSGLITTYRWQKKVAGWVREIHPDAFIVSGGGLPTDIGGQLLDWIPELDGIHTGEGDITIFEILKAAAAKREGRRHAAPSIEERDGRYLFHGVNEGNLDSLPLPAWDLLPIEIYIPNPIWGGNANNSSSLKFVSQRSMNVLTSRGCPWKCKFCVSAYGYGRYRFRSAKNVLAEVTHVMERFGVDFIGFVDDNFMVKRDRLREICGELKPLGVKWGCHGRLDQATSEALDLMADAGCIYIGYGGESASQGVLDSMNKHITVAEMQRAIDDTKRVGITANLTWISGYPGERREDLRRTARFILDNELGNRRMFVATAYPGTPLFEESKEKILAKFGDLENYVRQLDDATKYLINLGSMPDEEFEEIRMLLGAGELERI